MKCFFVFVLLGLARISAWSQSHPKTRELVDSVAAGMCRCMNNTFINIDEDVKTLVTNAINDPVNGQLEIQNHLARVGEERAGEIMNQLQKLGSIDSELTSCFSASTQRFQNLQRELVGLSGQEKELVALDFESEEKTIDLLMSGMRARSDCGFAYQFIKLGLELKQK